VDGAVELELDDAAVELRQRVAGQSNLSLQLTEQLKFDLAPSLALTEVGVTNAGSTGGSRSGSGGWLVGLPMQISKEMGRSTMAVSK
jgi:hypothetical protein